MIRLKKKAEKYDHIRLLQGRNEEVWFVLELVLHGGKSYYLLLALHPLTSTLLRNIGSCNGKSIKFFWYFKNQFRLTKHSVIFSLSWENSTAWSLVGNNMELYLISIAISHFWYKLEVCSALKSVVPKPVLRVPVTENHHCYSHLFLALEAVPFSATRWSNSEHSFQLHSYSVK